MCFVAKVGAHDSKMTNASYMHRNSGRKKRLLAKLAFEYLTCSAAKHNIQSCSNESLTWFLYSAIKRAIVTNLLLVLCSVAKHAFVMNLLMVLVFCCKVYYI